MTETLRRQLVFYQRRMMEVKGDTEAHEIYRNKTRELAEEIQEKEKTVCSQQTVQHLNIPVLSLMDN